MRRHSENNTTAKHLVILGAGFAGLKLARRLNSHPAYRITLIDRNNYHQFQPLLHQVATASLDASNISFPLRYIFQKSKNVTVKITDVISVDIPGKRVETSRGKINYDYLVIAIGADTNYYGNRPVQENVFPMKSTVEALQLRNRLIENLEEASFLKDEKAIESLLTVVVVGGGPTGIELSGALAEMKRDILPKDYGELDFKKMKIYLLEGSGSILNSMSRSASEKSHRYLEEMGVMVRTKAIVENYDGNTVRLKDGSVISAKLVIWVAGVKGKLLSGIGQHYLAPGDRIRVDGFNRVMGRTDIFALGDIAFVESAGHPQLARVAIDQAENLAYNFRRMVNHKPLREYVYQNKGTMATIGRNKAVVDLARPPVSFYGYFAWLTWMAIHLFLLIGVKNKIIVFINWTYQYIARNQSLSLMFPFFSRKKRAGEEHYRYL